MNRFLSFVILVAWPHFALAQVLVAQPLSFQQQVAQQIRTQFGGDAVINDRGDVVSVDVSSEARMKARQQVVASRDRTNSGVSWPPFLDPLDDVVLKSVSALPQLESLNLQSAEVTDAGLLQLRRLTNLRALDLSNTNVTDRGLAILQNFSRLESLTLVGTKVTDAGLVYLEGLARLQSLDLSATKITGTGLVHLRRLPQLRSLKLLLTPTTDAGLVNLKGLTQLQTLHLAYTWVTDAGMSQLAGLGQLKDLSLPRSITDAGLPSLQGMTQLETLNLNGAQVTDRGLAYLAGLSRLETLNLGDTVITDAGLANLAGMQQLRLLGLDETGVTDTGLVHLKGFARLEELNLTGLEITGPGMAHLAAMPQLKVLHLTNTKLTDAGLQHLQGMTGLQDLQLGGTSITRAGLRYLNQLSQLKKLNLCETLVSAEDAAELQKALPGCTIHHYPRVEPEKPAQVNDWRQAVAAKPRRPPNPLGLPIAIGPRLPPAKPGGLPADIEQLLWWLPEDTESFIVSRGNIPLEEKLKPRVESPVAVAQGLAPPAGEVSYLAPLAGEFYGFTNTHVDFPDLLADRCRTALCESKPLASGNRGAQLMQSYFGRQTARLFASAVWWRNGAIRESCDIIVFADATGDQIIKSVGTLAHVPHNVDGLRVLEVDMDLNGNGPFGLHPGLVADLQIRDAALAGKRWLGAPHPQVYVAATSPEFMQTIIARMRRGGLRRALPDELPEWRQLDPALPAWGLRHYRAATADKDGLSMLRWDSNAQGLVMVGGNEPSPHIALRYISTSPDAGSRFFQMQRFWLSRFAFRSREINVVPPFEPRGPACVESRTRINVPTDEINRLPLRNLDEGSTFSLSMPLMFLPWLGFPFRI